MSKKIKLEVSGREVTVSPLKIKHVKQALVINDDVEQSITLISISTGMTKEEIDDMDLRDFSQLQEVVKPFLGYAR